MPEIKVLETTIKQEILNYLGLPSGWLRRLAGLLLRLPAARFARLASGFEAQVESGGFGAASAWLLPRLMAGYRVSGQESIPTSGGLVLAANHPGTFDTFLIAACLPRRDVRVIARDMPLLRMLPSVAHQLIFSSRDPHFKMAAARAAIRHVRSGGALIIYPTGMLDPDPAFMPGADHAIGRWSNSLELLLHNAPEARLQAVISSAVLDAAYFRHPLVRIQKELRWKQILAEIVQMSNQFVFSGRHKPAPLVTFGALKDQAQLTSGGRSLLQGAMDAGRACLALHSPGAIANPVTRVCFE